MGHLALLPSVSPGSASETSGLIKALLIAKKIGQFLLTKSRSIHINHVRVAVIEGRAYFK